MAELEDGIRDLHEQLNKFPVNDPQNVSRLFYNMLLYKPFE